MSAEDVSNKHFNVKRTIKEGKKAYKMLFGNSDENNYWLASSYVNNGRYNAEFGLHAVYDGGVYGHEIVNAYGWARLLRR